MKKGFTLIELLAVILILGIIALIAIPVVTNVIEDSKKNAAKDSALNYIKAINDQNALAQLDANKYTTISSGDVSGLDVNINGEGPSQGNIVVTNGKVTEAEICFNGYTVTYNGNTATVGEKCGSSSAIEFNGTYASPSLSETHKGIVYLNPTDLTVECNASNSQIGTGSLPASGCMRFYIFDDEGANYKMILDHNTTNAVNWSSIMSNSEMDTAQAALESDTAGWSGSPRLITANEVAHVVGADRQDTLQWDSDLPYGAEIGVSSNWFYLDGSSNNTYSSINGWQAKSVNMSNKSKYAWLYDYTNNCAQDGCNNVYSGTYGYWTSTPSSRNSFIVWRVANVATLSDVAVDRGDYYGIRPVIELSKSLFN